jgi:hypothetical protein
MAAKKVNKGIKFKKQMLTNAKKMLTNAKTKKKGVLKNSYLAFLFLYLYL